MVMVMVMRVVGYEALVGFRAGIRGPTRASKQRTLHHKRENTHT